MLLDKYGSYIHTAFTGANGTWRLIASESNGPVMQTLDTFKSDSGQRTTVTRQQVSDWFKVKKIWL